jgi:molybdopterin synthase catalytic subunit
MRVRVHLFAGLRERLGAPEVDLEVRDGATVDDALAALGRRHEGLAGSRFTTALNRRYVERSAAIADGDELALIPPVSGG